MTSNSAAKPIRLPLASLVLTLLLAWLGVSPAAAQYSRPDAFDKDEKLIRVQNQARGEATVVEHTGEKLPLDLFFTDSRGESVRLGDIVNGERPVIIQMAYYKCPMLCGEVMNGMVSSMRALSEDLKIGEDYEVITLSFDPSEKPELAAENKKRVVEVMGRSAGEENVDAGWHFMVGDRYSIDKLADALGFGYAWIDEAKEYSHPAVITFVAPDGTISRYMHGVKYDPTAVRLSTIDASQGKLSPGVKDAFIFLCFSYDHATGKYTATARTIMMIGGGVTVVTLGSIIGFLLLAERRGRRFRDDDPPHGGAAADSTSNTKGAFA